MVVHSIAVNLVGEIKMEIKKIEYLNLDLLYKAICNITKIANNYEDLLANVAITLHINNISKSEYLFLKLMTSKIYRLKEFEYKSSYDAFPELDNTIIKKKINEYMKSCEESGIDTKDFDDIYMPLGFMTTDVIATFTGASLIPIFTLSPKSVIITLTTGDCLDNETGALIPDFDILYLDSDSKREMFDARFMNHFISVFYKQVLSNVTSFNDTDRFINDECLKMENDDFILPEIVNVFNPYLSMKYNNNFKGNVGLIEADIDKDFVIQNTSVTFNCNLPITAFISLLDYMPKEKIVSRNPFIIPIKSSELGDTDNLNIFIPDNEQLIKDTIKLVNVMSSIINDTYRSDKELILKSYFLLFGMESIKFQINVDMKDLDIWVVPMSNALRSKRENITNDMLYNFVTSIINKTIGIYKDYLSAKK